MKRLFLIAALILAGVPAQVHAQANMLGALPIDNIKCEGMEGAVVHIHQHIALYDKGREVQVPANIGIHGGANCLYWVHTHTNDGLIHNESPNRRVFTLGNFFDIWGQELSWYVAGPVHAVRGHKLIIQVNGHGYKGKDPRNIPLRNHEEIVIQSGPPYARVIKKISWGSVG